MNDSPQQPLDDRDETAEPASARAPLLDPPVAVEAVIGFLLSGLLCWNAWPWIAAHAAGGSAPDVAGAGAAVATVPADPSAIVAAVLLYGLAWPAIAAATMGALHYALRGLPPGLRLKVSGVLLAMLVAAMLV
jgi:hypothetical protein